MRSTTLERSGTQPVAIAPRLYRLATFDAFDESVPLEYVGRILRDGSDDDREYARQAIAQYNDYVAQVDECTMVMSVFEVG